MKKLYVGMGLTLAPESFRTDFQAELKSKLRALPDIEIIDFIGLENGTEADVYRHDKKSAEGCDLFIGICDHASIGLGMEIVFRHTANVPMLLFAHEDAKVTRMLLGFAEVEQHEFIRYQTVEDIVKRVQAEVEA